MHYKEIGQNVRNINVLFDKLFLHEGHIASRRSASLFTPGGSSFGYENITGVSVFNLSERRVKSAMVQKY